MYASTIGGEESHRRLASALDDLLRINSQQDEPKVIWRLRTTKQGLVHHASASSNLFFDTSNRVLVFPPSKHDIVLDDSILDQVERAWRAILDTAADDAEFLRFPARAEQDED